MSAVLLESDEGAWTMTLRRPARRNVLDAEMRHSLSDAVATVAGDPEARSLVVSSEGPVFCAGADLPELFDHPGRSVADTRRHLLGVYESFLALRALPVPTIAAVQGPAIGAGLNLALSCDVRILGHEATMSAVFSRIGLHPGGGCTYFLVDAIGRQAAMALLLDGGTLGAQASVAHGLGLEVSDDPRARATALATSWSALGPDLARDIKTAVGIAHGGDFDATVEFEAWAQASSAQGPTIGKVLRRFQREAPSQA